MLVTILIVGPDGSILEAVTYSEAAETAPEAAPEVTGEQPPTTTPTPPTPPPALPTGEVVLPEQWVAPVTTTTTTTVPLLDRVAREIFESRLDVTPTGRR